jgi:hypothetical protein
MYNIAKPFGIVIYTIAVIMFHSGNIFFSSKRLDYMSVFMYLWHHNLKFLINKLVQFTIATIYIACIIYTVAAIS